MNIKPISPYHPLGHFKRHVPSLSFAMALILGTGALYAHYRGLGAQWTYRLGGCSACLFALALAASVAKKEKGQGKTPFAPCEQTSIPAAGSQAHSSPKSNIPPQAPPNPSIKTGKEIDSRQLWELRDRIQKTENPQETGMLLKTNNVTSRELTAPLKSFFRETTLIQTLMDLYSKDPDKILETLKSADIPLAFHCNGKFFLQYLIESHPYNFKTTFSALSPDDLTSEQAADLLTWLLHDRLLGDLALAVRLGAKLKSLPELPEMDHISLIRKGVEEFEYGKIVPFLKACNFSPEALIKIKINEKPILWKFSQGKNLIPAAALLKEHGFLNLEVFKSLEYICSPPNNSASLMNLIQGLIDPGTSFFQFVIRENLHHQAIYFGALEDEDLNSLDANGNTLLHHAALADNTRAIQILLRKMAPRYVKNHNGETEYAIAKKQGHQEAANLLYLPPHKRCSKIISQADATPSMMSQMLKEEGLTEELLTTPFQAGSMPTLLDHLLHHRLREAPKILHDAGLSLTFPWPGNPFFHSYLIQNPSRDQDIAPLISSIGLSQEQWANLIVDLFKFKRYEMAELFMENLYPSACINLDPTVQKEIISDVIFRWKSEEKLVILFKLFNLSPNDLLEKRKFDHFPLLNHLCRKSNPSKTAAILKKHGFLGLETWKVLLKEAKSTSYALDVFHMYNEPALNPKDKIILGFHLLEKNAVSILETLNPAELNWTDSFGNSFLHHAASANNEPVLTFLLNEGLLPSLINQRGETALDVAIRLKKVLAVFTLSSYQILYNPIVREQETTLKIFNGLYKKYVNQEKELPMNFSQKELSKRYRQIMLKCHPDKKGSNEDSEKLNNAMDILKTNRS